MPIVTTIHARSRPATKVRQFADELITYTVEYGSLSTSAISTSAWAADDSSVTIGSEANGDHNASCTLTASSTGTYRVTNTVTLADASVYKRHLDITVMRNEADSDLSDYQEQVS